MRLKRRLAGPSIAPKIRLIVIFELEKCLDWPCAKHLAQQAPLTVARVANGALALGEVNGEAALGTGLTFYLRTRHGRMHAVVSAALSWARSLPRPSGKIYMCIHM